MSPDATPAASRHVWAVRIACLALLLAAHFAARWQVARTLTTGGGGPLWASASLYPDVYRVSLSLAEGRGYRTIALGGPPLTEEGMLEPGAAVEPSPEARPLLEFFRFERQRLSRDQLDAYWASADAASPETGNYESGRVFDLYAVALLWRLFGVSWPVFFAFCAASSTACCLAAVLIAWRLSYSWLAGLAAGALFAVSPFETLFAIRTVRDISPLWAATFSFAVFVLCVERFKSAWANGLAAFALGAVALAGKGWRSDAMLLAPILFAALAVTAWRARGWLASLSACGLYALGASAVLLVLSLIAPPPPGSNSTSFHVAYYGYSARANVLGVENSLRVARCDLDTYYRVRERHLADGLPGRPPRIYGPGYGELCRAMYLDALPYHAHVYARAFPWFYWQAHSALPAEGLVQGEDVGLARSGQHPRLRVVYGWCMGPLTAALPALFVLGAAALFLAGYERARGGWLLLFSGYYALILLAVLPERKHAGQLLLPLYVFAGLGVAALARLARAAWERDLPAPDASGLRWAVGSAAAALALWLGACVVTYPISRAERQKMLADVRERAAEGEDASAHLAGPRWFSARDTGRATGYLLTVQAETGGGLLLCRVARPHVGSVPGRDHVTRHRLHAGRQSFCVCLPSDEDGDPRAMACSVRLPEGARFLSCVKFRPAPGRLAGLATLFTEDDAHPGPPLVGTTLAADLIGGCGPSDIRYEAEACAFAPSGLPLEGALSMRPAATTEVDLARLEGEDAEIAAGPSGATVTARPYTMGHALAPVFEAPHDGDYLFEARYRRGTSAAHLVLRPQADGPAPQAVTWAGPREGQMRTLCVLARLRRGERVRAVIVSLDNLSSCPASFTVEALRVVAVPAELARLAAPGR